MVYVDWTSISIGDVIHDEPFGEISGNLGYLYTDLGINRNASCGCDWSDWWNIKGKDEYGKSAYVISSSQWQEVRDVIDYGSGNRCPSDNASDDSSIDATDNGTVESSYDSSVNVNVDGTVYSPRDVTRNANDDGTINATKDITRNSTNNSTDNSPNDSTAYSPRNNVVG